MSGGDEPGVWSGSAWTTTRKPRSSVIHGRLSAPTPSVLNHDTLSADAVLEPWNWVSNGVWYLFMDESRGVPLDTVIDGKPSTESN